MNTKLHIDELDDSEIQDSSLLKIFSINDPKTLDKYFTMYNKPEYENVLKKINLIIIGRATGLLSEKASQILSDPDIVKSLFKMEPDIERLKVILKYELDHRVDKNDHVEKIRLNLFTYDELKEMYLNIFMLTAKPEDYDGFYLKMEIEEEKEKIVESIIGRENSHSPPHFPGQSAPHSPHFPGQSAPNPPHFPGQSAPHPPHFPGQSAPLIFVPTFRHEDHPEIKMKVFNFRESKTYLLNSIVGLSFMDLDTGLVSTIKEVENDRAYYNFNPNNEDESFMPLLTREVQEDGTIIRKQNLRLLDGSYLFMFTAKPEDYDGFYLKMEIEEEKQKIVESIIGRENSHSPPHFPVQPGNIHSNQFPH